MTQPGSAREEEIRAWHEREGFSLQALPSPVFLVACQLHEDRGWLLRELAALREQVRAAEARAEQAEVQLAGCSVAATGGATGKNDCGQGDYGWSPAFDDVKKLRARADALAKDVTRLKAERFLLEQGLK